MIWIGTSGWQYRDWRRRFYPRDLAQRDWLPFFSERFATVEVNNSFYRLPEADTFVAWRDRSAAGFRFAVKASRYITHVRRLRDAAGPVRTFMERARRLGDKLGPVLYQLPPNFPADPDRLAAFLEGLPRDPPAAFEFRHPSWDDTGVRGLLDAHDCAWVLADRPGWRYREVVTGGWAYVRFHQGRRTAPGYARRKLATWAGRLADLPARDVYVYFNNDTGGAALRDGATLTELLRARRVPVRGAREAPP